MEKTEWMKQVVRAGRDFHVRQEDPLKHNILNLFSALLLWGLCAGCFWSAPIFLSHGNRGWSVCRNPFFGHFILVIHECSHNMFLKGLNPKQTKKKSIDLLVSQLPHLSLLNMFYTGKRVTSHTTFNPAKRQTHKTQILFMENVSISNCFDCGLFPFILSTPIPLKKYPKTARRFFWGLLFWSVVLFPVFSLKTLVMWVLAWNVVNTLNLLKIAQEHGGELANEPLPIMRSRTYFFLSPSNALLSFLHQLSF